MDNIESLVYRIINKYFYININNITYKIMMPDIKQKYQAHCLYSSIIDNNKFDDRWISSDTINNFLSKYNLWNKDKENSLKELYKTLDKTKIEYYLNFNNSSTKNQIKKIIDNLNQTITKESYTKHQFDYLTLEFYAQNIKNQYLLSTMVYIDDSRVFSENFETIDINQLNNFATEINNYTISYDDIKSIARNEVWKSYWISGKDKVFEGNITEWTEEQRSLVNFSKMLDSIREHMDAPSEEIINDDIALDGWILYENDKSEKEKKQKMVSEKYGLHKKNGNEVFLLTDPNNKEETREIYSLNDLQTNKEIEEMRQFAKSQSGPVQWSDIPHVQRAIKQELMNMNKSN